MAIKDLAVAYNGTANSHAALRLAVRMAAKYGASITGLHVNPPLNLDNQTRQWIPDSILETLQKAEQDSVSGIKAQFREELAALGHTSKGDWIAEQGEPNRVLAKGARYFDIKRSEGGNPPGRHRAALRQARDCRAEEICRPTLQ